MIKHFLFVFLFLGILGCHEGKVYSEKNVEFMISEQLYEAVKSEYYRGNETSSRLNEVAQDKSERFRSLKAMEILNIVEGIDSAVAVIIIKTSRLKESMIHNPTVLKEIKNNKRNSNNWAPVRISLEDEMLFFPKNAQQKLKELKKDLFIYRSKLISKIAEHISRDSVRYYFKDPNIQSYNDRKNLMMQIERAIANSNVTMDDQESIKRIYHQLTCAIVEFPSKIAEPINFLNVLLCVEREIFSARADALSLIGLRSSFTDCRMDTYVPVVECPAVCYVDDSVELRALLGAYDTSEDLSVEANGKKFESVKDGIAYQKVMIPNKKELVLNGTMTVRNKSGVPKVIPWQKKIKILPKEMKFSK